MAVNRMGPPCPECGSLLTDVIRTNRTEDGHFVRHRSCPCCGHRFHTVQTAEYVARNDSIKWVANRTYRINWDMLPVQIDAA